MPNLEEHLRTFSEDNPFCASSHKDDFSELLAGYHEAEEFLEKDLAQDITPERIFIRGTIHAPNTIVLDFDDMPGPDPVDAPRASIERWAEKDATIVCVSKTAEIDQSLAADYIDNKNKRRWFRDVSIERRAKIIATVLRANGLELDTFTAQPTMDDTTLRRLRSAVSSRFSYPYKSESTELVDTTVTGYDPLAEGQRPESYLMRHVSYIRPVAFFGMSEKEIASLPIEEQASKLEKAKQFVTHDNGLSLLVATNALRRAANIVRTGRIVTPSIPQNRLYRYDKIID